jgi:FAD synthase
MILRHLPGEEGQEDTALGIGVFDGLHLGHQQLVEEVIGVAHQQSLIPSILTFDPPPPVLLEEPGFRPLLTLSEKVELLEKMGVVILFILRFTWELSNLSASQFIQAILQWAHPRVIIVGSNFYFGREREGNAQALVEFGQSQDFQVRVLPLMEDPEGGPISSSRIRQLLAQGKVQDANRLLGHPYHAFFNLDHRTGAYQAKGEGKLLPQDGHYRLLLEPGLLYRDGIISEGRLQLSGNPPSRLSVSFLERIGPSPLPSPRCGKISPS